MGSYDEYDLPEGLTGDVRLLPLPNLVMFPHVLQPLHIHEPRYREMLNDAMEDDQLLAMALLEPGWEQDYDGRPPVAHMVCVARVVSHARESDGRYNVLLMGARRAQIRQELPLQRSFRQAEVRFMGDYYADAAAPDRQKLKGQLVDRFRAHLPNTQVVREQFEQLLGSQIPLGVLTDIVAFTVNLELRVKQQLLQQLDVDRRAAVLLEQLRARRPTSAAPAHGFPPLFSTN